MNRRRPTPPSSSGPASGAPAWVRRHQTPRRAPAPAVGTRVDLAGWADVPSACTSATGPGTPSLALHAVATLAQRDGWSLDPFAVGTGWRAPIRRFRAAVGTGARRGAGRCARRSSCRRWRRRSATGSRTGAVTWVLALARDRTSTRPCGRSRPAPGGSSPPSCRRPDRPAVTRTRGLVSPPRIAAAAAGPTSEPSRNPIRDGPETRAAHRRPHLGGGRDRIVPAAFAVVDDPAPG
ncbi:hypothetical protein HBB16_02195 [Pseudonocardia sp. MCCB 268]|nr:hypothetical protein [Pseudonocardia cytotoxica]